jgi:hypothetical protein
MKKSSRDRRVQLRAKKRYGLKDGVKMYRYGYKNKKGNKYDGSKIPNLFIILQEQQMWDDIDRTRIENPWLAQLATKGSGVIGKSMFTSTVEEGVSCYRTVWEDGDDNKENGLYRYFIPHSELYSREYIVSLREEFKDKDCEPAPERRKSPR